MKQLPPTYKRLALMRHATAEPAAASDHQRSLAAAGPIEAQAAARWAQEAGFQPDHVLVSDALRTQQTAQAALEVFGGAPLWDATRAVYEAGPDALLDLIRTVPAEVNDLLVVGHNPAVAQLSQLLDSGEGLRVDPRSGFPPASLTIFALPSAWLDLGMFQAAVLATRTGDEPRTP